MTSLSHTSAPRKSEPIDRLEHLFERIAGAVERIDQMTQLHQYRTLAGPVSAINFNMIVGTLHERLAALEARSPTQPVTERCE